MPQFSLRSFLVIPFLVLFLSATALIAAADGALYAAKNNGRNCVKIAGNPST